jgi:type VI secretion system protein ImpC
MHVVQLQTLGYDMVTNGVANHHTLPLVIGVLADLYAEGTPNEQDIPLQERPWMEVSSSTLDTVLKGLRPSPSTVLGLRYLLAKVDKLPQVHVKLLNVSGRDALHDLEKAIAPNQSMLFDRVIRQGLGTFGADPIGLLVTDYVIGHSPEDVALARLLSQIGQEAYAPCILSSSPEMFSLLSFDDLHRPRSLMKIFEGMEHAEWIQFRQEESAKFAAITLPAMTRPANTSEQTETLINSSWVLAARVVRAFGAFDWPVAFTGFEDDDLIPSINISVDKAEELIDLGFVPVCARYGVQQTAALGAMSASRPKKYLNEGSSLEAKQQASLQTTMVMARFLHTIRALTREETGSLIKPEQLQERLNAWLQHYVQDRAIDTNALKPLRSASVGLIPLHGKNGAYIKLKIHPTWQMNWLTAPLEATFSVQLR